MTTHFQLDKPVPGVTRSPGSAPTAMEPAIVESGHVIPAGCGEKPGKRTKSYRSFLRRTLFVLVDGLAAAVAVTVCGGAVAGSVLFAAAVALTDFLDRRRVYRLASSALDDLPGLALRGLLVAGAATLAGVPVAGQGIPGARDGAAWLITAIAFATIAAVGRAVGYAGLKRLHAAGKLTSTALVVGAGSMGRRIVRRLNDHPQYGIVPVGYADKTARQPSIQPGLLLGDVSDLPKLIARHGVHYVFVAFGRTRHIDMVDLLRACDRLDCEIFVVPRFFELGVGASPADHLWGVPVIRLHREAFRARTWRAKRILDIAITALALVPAAPVMLAVALALRLEVGPNVVFRQIRVGLDGRPFELLKFRTLRPPRNGEQADFCEVSPDRIGPVGRFVRRSSLDELPQLWNVLRGQMSLVGPRPEQPHYARRFARSFPRYRERLRVPAGVTGLAQIHDLRGSTPIEDRVCFDNFYIEHWSLWQDIKILVRTVASVIGMRGK